MDDASISISLASVCGAPACNEVEVDESRVPIENDADTSTTLHVEQYVVHRGAVYLSLVEAYQIYA